MISRDSDRDDRTTRMSSRPEAKSDGRPDSSVAVVGVVFCGGRSRRMGSDKAELEVPGRPGMTLLERALQVLDGVADSVVLATGAAPRYEALGRTCVLDQVTDAGPLAGLSAALENTGAEWLCALACDMPDVDATLVQKLLDHARENELDVCLLETESGVEPLCAVYRRTCREAVSQSLVSGEFKMVGFHGDGLRVGTLSARALTGSEGCALNLNTRADYARVLDSARTRDSSGEAS